MIKLRHHNSSIGCGVRKLRPIGAASLLWFGLLCPFGAAQGALSHDFGSISVNAAGSTYAFAATLSGVSAVPGFSISGASFSLSSMACTLAGTVASCTGSVVFAPQYPGLQTAAVYAKTSSGILLATYLFRGVGLASQLAFAPGTIATFAGTGTWGYTNGALNGSTFRNPAGIAIDQAGNLYVADSVNQVVRRMTSSAVTTFAGNGQAGYSGDNGLATAATLNDPTGVALDAANNLYIADQGNNLIRRVDAVSGIITTVAGGGSTQVTVAGGVAALTASLFGPQSLVVDPAGNLFISDSLHQKVLRLDAGTNLLSVYAGGGTGGSSDGLGDGNAATAAILSNPAGLALDSSNNLYIVDTGDSMVRMVNAATGVITIVAGSGGYGYSGDSGPATSATFASPASVRVDAAGNLFIADLGNNVIRLVLSGSGTISTFAGNGSTGYSGDGGASTGALLANPSDIALAPSGRLFIADYGNNVIRSVTPLPPAVNFGSVVVATLSTPQAVSLINRGNQPLTLTGLAVGSGFKQLSSAAACSASSVLQSGIECGVDLEFAPTAAGTISTNLSVTSNSLNSTGTASLALSGVGAAGAAPVPTLSATSLNFGTLASGGSQSQAVTLLNTGSAALNLAGISLSGSSAFTMSTTCGNSLAAAASCTITVSFSPVTSISYSATVSIVDQAATSPQQISISGSGTGGPAGSVSSNALYFSSVLSNGSIAQSITLTNTGTGNLSIAGISLGGPNSTEFTLTTACGYTLAAAQSCSTSVYFSPAAAGVRTATLSIVDNSASSPHIISLSGAGPTTPLQFLPVTPCRLVDTRSANGAFGGPQLGANVTRSFAIPNSSCGIPANAAAYSLNITVVPGNALGYLAVWPLGIAQPLVSTLTLEFQVRANAAVVSAGVGGAIQVYVSAASDVILDIDGYFVAGSASALKFYPVAPCRLVDTRLPTGALGGPSLPSGVARSFPILSGSCNIPATAQAYSLNFTSVPQGPLYFLSTWPTGQPQPLVSTLNAGNATVTANAAIVPAGTGGAVEVYASNTSDVIIDIDGYFAPAATGGLSLYTVTPCRALDTRLTVGNFTGTLNANIGASLCAPPASAQAFILNATVVPPGYFGYLSLWATGSAQPLVSTLNDTNGTIVSNMAIVPAASGSISAFASNPTPLILDISAYFAP